VSNFSIHLEYRNFLKNLIENTWEHPNCTSTINNLWQRLSTSYHLCCSVLDQSRTAERLKTKPFEIACTRVYRIDRAATYCYSIIVSRVSVIYLPTNCFCPKIRPIFILKRQRLFFPLFGSEDRHFPYRFICPPRSRSREPPRRSDAQKPYTCENRRRRKTRTLSVNGNDRSGVWEKCVCVSGGEPFDNRRGYRYVPTRFSLRRSMTTARRGFHKYLARGPPRISPRPSRIKNTSVITCTNMLHRGRQIPRAIVVSN